MRSVYKNAKELGSIVFCKEKMVFGIVAQQEADGKISKIWTPLGFVETVQLTIIIVKSLWDLYKLIRLIWKEIKKGKNILVKEWKEHE